MYYDNVSRRWKLESLRDPAKKIQTANRLPEELPIGTHDWQACRFDYDEDMTYFI